MSTQSALEDMAMGVDEAREESYSWEYANVRGWNGLSVYISLFNGNNMSII